MMTFEREVKNVEKSLRGTAEILQGSGKRFVLDEDHATALVNLVRELRRDHYPIDDVRTKVLEYCKERGALREIPEAIFTELEAEFHAKRPGRPFDREIRREIESLFDGGISQEIAKAHIVSMDEIRQDREDHGRAPSLSATERLQELKRALPEESIEQQDEHRSDRGR